MSALSDLQRRLDAMLHDPSLTGGERPNPAQRARQFPGMGGHFPGHHGMLPGPGGTPPNPEFMPTPMFNPGGINQPQAPQQAIDPRLVQLIQHLVSRQGTFNGTPRQSQTPRMPGDAVHLGSGVFYSPTRGYINFARHQIQGGGSNSAQMI